MTPTRHGWPQRWLIFAAGKKLFRYNRHMTGRILLIRTGGTIDAAPYDDPKRPPPFVTTLGSTESLVMPTVSRLVEGANVDGFSWGLSEERFVKDSQLFTPDDLTALADVIRRDDHAYFVVTHGTDAMAKNAAFLQEMLKGSGKVVVFTGAMVPLSMSSRHKGDGEEALDFALKHVTAQRPGVYVMGRDAHTKRLGFYNSDEVQKDRDASAASLKFIIKLSAYRA